MRPITFPFFGALLSVAACVPPGNSTPTDSGPPSPSVALAPTVRPSVNVMTAPFFDNFDRPNSAIGPALPLDAGNPFATPTMSVSPTPTAPVVLIMDAAALLDAAIKPLDAKAAADAKSAEAASGDALVATTAEAAAVDPELEPIGPDWLVTAPARRAWRIENGKLCGQNARNHGIWLKRTLPVNARIEYDAISYSDDGDLKSEVWGDGVSSATSTSYTNATSYLVIFGGWKNQYHVIARINEHGNDRKEIKIDPTSDDPKEKPVIRGQQYHIKVERTDGKTIKYFVDDVEYLTYGDPAPLTGAGHDHMGFNEWTVKVCFDNVKVTPLGTGL